MIKGFIVMWLITWFALGGFGFIMLAVGVIAYIYSKVR